MIIFDFTLGICLFKDLECTQCHLKVFTCTCMSVVSVVSCSGRGSLERGHVGKVVVWVVYLGQNYRLRELIQKGQKLNYSHYSLQGMRKHSMKKTSCNTIILSSNNNIHQNLLSNNPKCSFQNNSMSISLRLFSPLLTVTFLSNNVKGSPRTLRVICPGVPVSPPPPFGLVRSMNKKFCLNH